MKNLEENLKDYYNSKSLTSEKADLLLGGKKKINKNNRIYSIIAASILFLFIIGSSMTIYMKKSLDMNVVKEIAKNHNKQLSVEFSSSSLDDLGKKLAKLDFNLADAGSEISGKYKLLGGRYCSIQGNLAAQLKVQNSNNNKIETLYISGLNSDLDKINPIDTDYEGVNIRIWKANGLIYGKASDL